MSNKLDQNRKNVIAFYEMMFNDCEPKRAIELFAGPEYIQHNPHVADGKQGFIDYFMQMAREYLGKSVSIKRTVAELRESAYDPIQKWALVSQTSEN